MDRAAINSNTCFLIIMFGVSKADDSFLVYSSWLTIWSNPTLEFMTVFTQSTHCKISIDLFHEKVLFSALRFDKRSKVLNKASKPSCSKKESIHCTSAVLILCLKPEKFCMDGYCKSLMHSSGSAFSRLATCSSNSSFSLCAFLMALVHIRLPNISL